MEKNDWMSKATGILSVLVLVYLLGRYGVPILAPFLLAGVIVLFVRPWGKRLSGITAVRPGICNVLVLLALLGLLSGAAYLGGYYLWREITAFYAWLSENADSVVTALGGLFSTSGQGIALPKLLQKIIELPLFADFFGGIDALVHTLTQALLGRLGEALSGAAINAASGVPSMALAVLVFVLSCFYLSLDGEKLLGCIIGSLKKERQQSAREIISSVAGALRGYLRAYALIFLMTFSELLIGFLIIRVRYAVLVAILIALLDLLPVIGSGAVLIPWSAVAFLSGNVRVGAGLLILYGVITLVRQITEPKIVGSSIGLHPLAALAAMYVSFRLFGAVGLILGPCAAIVVKVILRQNRSGIASEPQ